MINVYDYREIETCFVMGSIDSKFNRFFDTVIKNLRNTDKYKVKEHPKEVERQTRIASQQDRPCAIRRSQKFKPNKPQLNDCVLIVNGCNSFGRNSLDSYIKKLAPLNEVLKDNNTFILFVRGNDNPQYFNDESISLSNIITIKDYSVVKLKYFNCLCIGGTISYDREWKIEQSEKLGKKLYWENEKMVYDEEKLNEILNNFKIEAVVTPNCPSFVSNSINHIKQISWVKKNDNLFNDLKNERLTLDKIYLKLNEHDSIPHFWSYSKKNQMLTPNVQNDIVFYPIKEMNFVSIKYVIEAYFNVKIGEDKKNDKKRISLSQESEIHSLDEIVNNTEEPIRNNALNELEERIINQWVELRYAEPQQIIDANELRINQDDALRTIDARDERLWGTLQQEPIEFTYDMETDTIINTATTLRQNVTNE